MLIIYFLDSDPCTYTFCKTNNDVCKLRIDFDTMVLSDPETSFSSPVVYTDGQKLGDCLTDTLTVTTPSKEKKNTVCSKMKVSKINAYKSKNIWGTKIFHTFLVSWITFMMVCLPNIFFQKNVHFLWTHLKSLFCQNLVFLHFGNGHNFFLTFRTIFYNKNSSLKVVVQPNWILSFVID